MSLIPSQKMISSLKKGGILLIYLMASLIFMTTYIVRSTFNGNPRSRYVDLVYQQADKPYVYRLIVPVMIRGISRLIPDQFETRINRLFIKYPSIIPGLSILSWEHEALNLYLIGMVVIYLFLFGFLITFRWLMQYLFITSPLGLILAPLTALVLLFPWVNVTYIYDFSSLFFFTLCLVLMLKQDWRSFMIVYLVACFNKETILLVSLQFILYEGFYKKMGKALFWKLLAGQLIGFLLIRLALSVIFRDLPGGHYEFHLLTHNLPLLAVWIKGFSPATYLLTLIILTFGFYAWNEQPVFLRYGLVTLLILIFLTFLFGWLNEWRDYLEAFPYIAALFIHNLFKVLKIPVSERIKPLAEAS
jgi:hypothetical protein